MVDPSSPDLFDFKELGAIIQEGQDNKEYYQNLLHARDGAKEAYLAVHPRATPEEIDIGIEEFLKPTPVKGLRKAAVDAWVRRRYHTLTKVVPIAALGAAALTFQGASKIHHNMQLNAQERDVEQMVESLYSTEQQLRHSIHQISADPAQGALPRAELARVNAHVQSASSYLAETSPWFGIHVKDGIADETITRDNFLQVSSTLTPIESDLESALREVDAARTVLDNQRKLEGAAAQIEANYSTIMGLAAIPEAIKQDAERTYNEGIRAAQTRNLTAALSASDALGQKRETANKYVALASAGPQLISRVRAMNCPSPNTKSAEQAFSEFESAQAHVDIAGMEQSKGRLEESAEVLAQSYEMHIVGGIWIYQKDNPSNKNWYVKVQAGSKENPIKVPIRDDDRGGIVVRTPVWGEEVPQKVYDHMSENGIPRNNSHVGTKERCELVPSYDWTYRTGWTNEFHMTESLSRIAPEFPDADLITPRASDRNWRR